MQMRKLGQTDIDVSLICLGTMTWGEQNTEQEAFEQLDPPLPPARAYIGIPRSSMTQRCLASGAGAQSCRGAAAPAAGAGELK